MSNLLNIFGNYSDREIKRIIPLIDKIDKLGEEYEKYTDEQLRDKTFEFKERVNKGESLDSLLPEAFATVREASCRVLKMKHYKVQLIGGIVLHQGRIAEMKTGEGKTLVATCPAYLNALSGKGVHIVTTNDYLVSRDRQEMGQIFEFLGLTVDVILHDMEPEQRRVAYAADITYGTNNELGFDYLRDNMALSKEERVLRDLNYVIVDEIDSILIDEARTPLIISGEGGEPADIYFAADEVVKTLKKDVHFTIDEKVKAVMLNEEGMAEVEKYFAIANYADKENRLLQHHVIQALRANYIMLRDRDYIVRDGEVLIVDEFTGRVMEGRRFSEGLHEAIEAKEALDIQNESQTLATITLQNFFNLYTKLSGMTGTAMTEEMEFREIYKLDVITIPTNKPVIRVDKNDVVYKTTKAKYYAIVEMITEAHKKGQPVLVGTASIQKSEDISALLKRRGIKHNVLNAKNHMKEAKIVEKAGQRGAVTIATNMAGRGTDIKLGEGVADLGGLMIIGTDKHESRRIDNQLRGRSGRQGDPGSSQFILSLEDELVAAFVPERFKDLYNTITTDENTPIESKWIGKALESAQKAVEGNHFVARKQLVAYDDVINVQRRVVFDERNKVLDEENIKEDVLEMLKAVIKRNADEHLQSEESEEFKKEIVNFINSVESSFLPKDTLKPEDFNNMSNEEVEQFVYNAALKIYGEREEKLGEAALREIERVTLLKIVDVKWVDHLDDLEFLREGIGYRAIKSVDPVQEFQLEASDMFDEMIYSIKLNTIQALFRL